jgi:hypothetical protein
MKAFAGFLAGIATTVVLGVAAEECIREGDITPTVQVVDMFTGQEYLQCKMTMIMLAGHQILCNKVPAGRYRFPPALTMPPAR